MINNKFYRYDISDTIAPVWFRIEQYRQDDDTIPEELSLLMANDQDKVISDLSFFHSSTKATGEINMQEIKYVDKDWLYGSFAIILVIIVILKIFYSIQINSLFKSFFTQGFSKPEIRLYPFKFDMFSVLFIFLYSMAYGLMLLFSLKELTTLSFIEKNPPELLFFSFSLAFLSIILMRFVLIRLTGTVFSVFDESIIYQDQMLASAFISSAFIVPLIVVYAFSSLSVFLIFALFLMVAIIVVRLLRSINISISLESFSVFHFILYICTLEILPLLIAGKMLLLFLN